MARERYARTGWSAQGVHVQGEIHTPGREISLPFQYNPTQVEFSRSVNWVEMDSPGVLQPQLWFGSGTPPEVSFTLFFDGREAPFEGGGVQELIDKVEAFTQPNPNIPLDTLQFNPPPVCIFRLGSIVHECVMSSVNTTITMFDKLLVPIRATCKVTLRRNHPTRFLDVERERHVRLAWNGAPSSGPLPSNFGPTVTLEL